MELPIKPFIYLCVQELSIYIRYGGTEVEWDVGELCWAEQHIPGQFTTYMPIIRKTKDAPTAFQSILGQAEWPWWRATALTLKYFPNI